jgi:DNA-damage-inducible protein D
MKSEMIHALTATFEAHAQQTENGIEYWLARDLQHLLGYDEWRNFNTPISKAKTACELSGHAIKDHFVDVNKMVDLGLFNTFLGLEARNVIAWAEGPGHPSAETSKPCKGVTA